MQTAGHRCDIDEGSAARKRTKLAAACGACRLGYVIVFEECDHEFSAGVATGAEAKNGARVRFIRGYS